MEELIKKLEDAKEGHCGLDLEIEEWLISDNPNLKMLNEEPGYLEYTGDTSGLLEQFPNYTTSVDAAMTLIPKWELGEYMWFLHHPGYDNGVLTNQYRCTIHHPCSSGGGPEVTSFAATAALAICIAALKARDL